MDDDAKWSAPLCYADDAVDALAELREEHDAYRTLARITIEALEIERRQIDQLLEDDFGGFYLSAPDELPLGKIRKLLRGER